MSPDLALAIVLALAPVTPARPLDDGPACSCPRCSCGERCGCDGGRCDCPGCGIVEAKPTAPTLPHTQKATDGGADWTLNEATGKWERPCATPTWLEITPTQQRAVPAYRFQSYAPAPAFPAFVPATQSRTRGGNQSC